jgi:hypothetical protein
MEELVKAFTLLFKVSGGFAEILYPNYHYSQAAAASPPQERFWLPAPSLAS